MTLTLSTETSLALAGQILSNVRERAEALASAVKAQREINNNPASHLAHSSLIQFPLQDAEVLADALEKALRLCVEKTIEF